MNILILITRLPHNEMTVIFGGYISQLLNAEVTLTHVISNKGERAAGEAFFEGIARENTPVTGGECSPSWLSSSNHPGRN